MNIKSLSRLIGINLAVLCAGLLAVELFFGTWFWGDPLSGLNVFRNVEWTYTVDGQYARKTPVTYRRDAWGLRGNYGEPGDVEILVVGGSTTDERFVSEGETWVDVLQQCLNALGRNLQVANGSVVGQSTRGHAANFDLWYRRIAGLKPRYVLAYVGINDIYAENDHNKIMDDPRRVNEERAPLASWAVHAQRARMNSALYRLYRTAKGQWKAFQAGLAPTPIDGKAERSIVKNRKVLADYQGDSVAVPSAAFEAGVAAFEKQLAGPLDNYRRRLKRLDREIREFGAQPIYVTQTWNTYRRDAGRVAGVLSHLYLQTAFNRVTLAHCRAEKHRCLDLAAEFDYRDGDTYDSVHTTPQGSARVGRYMCEKLKDL